MISITENFIKEVEKLAIKNNCKFFIEKELKNYTSFKIGGIAPIVVHINSMKSVVEIYTFCNENELSVLILGKGSNMLISDKGFDGVVLIIGDEFSNVTFLEDGKIHCESGITLAKLSNQCCKNGLSGLEFAHGIPGTLGGGIYMNAGAYGGEMKDVVLSVTALNNKGEVVTFSKDELELSYRHSFFTDKDYIVLSVEIQLKPDKTEDIRARMDELSQKRKTSQPIDFPSAGSTFKRPQGAFAAALIEECGLKGYQVGGAMVSKKHSGFVINYKNATFDDVMDVISHVKKVVLEKTGFTLECEVKIVE